VPSKDTYDIEIQKTEVIDSVQLKNISFAYGEQKILNEFSLQAEKGDFVGITGRSGRGKTTVFNLLLGFLAPASGTVSVNGKAIDQKEMQTYWNAMAYVRQQPFLIHDTILRNITLQESVYDEERLKNAVFNSGLEQFISLYDEGVQKMVTENGKNISGGQQQRITIARALYKNADLLLLDEPFNELDEVSVIRLLEHFRQLALGGKIVIMITHDKKSLSYCDKIISLDDE
jgi:ABC-type bacteriocin/lantibiotic exporter with double-glycine peptidase domain